MVSEIVHFCSNKMLNMKKSFSLYGRKTPIILRMCLNKKLAGVIIFLQFLRQALKSKEIYIEAKTLE